ncbi:MAG TPA: thiamine phosphate synthase [Candidatus Sulfotelmatobacter sp.]|jgi:thiamine-phosphate pyrophosphorylase|nr:thiamine phosphate synthase [Candidatus Sulfotelmatobacter sp.]
MKHTYHQIIDANLNRVSEGFRVIEDYTRFIAKQKSFTDQLAKLRKQINRSESDLVNNLLIRNTDEDMRAKEIPQKREDIVDLLKANFKRIEEGLRVLEEYTGNALYNEIRYAAYELEKAVVLHTMKKNIMPGIYLISDDITILEQGLKWGVSVIQLRDKQSPKQEVLRKALAIKEKAKKANIPFIINDYIDIAMVSDADGLHTGQDDLDLPLIRKMLGPQKIIGRSTNTLEQGIEAQKQGADYIGIGPIWSTISKPERAPIGLDYLRKAQKEIAIPYVAIGDVTLSHMADIASFRPPLVALIRAYREIPAIQKKYF